MKQFKEDKHDRVKRIKVPFDLDLDRVDIIKDIRPSTSISNEIEQIEKLYIREGL